MTLEERIVQLETNCTTMIEELTSLKAELAEKNETVWLPEEGESYLYIDGEGKINSCVRNSKNIGRVHLSNAFKPDDITSKHLRWYRDNVLRVQNKLMQLHELLCPDYFPDWDDDKEAKWYLAIYEGSWNKYWLSRYNTFTVYFTEEAASKACEILNKEKFLIDDKTIMI